MRPHAKLHDRLFGTSECRAGAMGSAEEIGVTATHQGESRIKTGTALGKPSQYIAMDQHVAGQLQPGSPEFSEAPAQFIPPRLVPLFRLAGILVISLLPKQIGF